MTFWPSPVKCLAIALAAFCFIPLSSRAALDPAAIHAVVDKAIRPLMAEHEVPGMAVAITIDGQPMFFNYGVASKEENKPVSENTLFELGSISKTFTATLACYAQLLGKLSFDDHPSKTMPRLSGSAIDQASLLDLGTFTAGGLPLQFPDEVSNDEQMLAYFRNWKPDAAPGTQRRYSNPSIGLLGQVTALALKADFGDAVEKQLFPGLGLKHSYIRVPENAMANYAWGYDRADKPVRVSPGVLDAPTYGVKSTSADMIRFVQSNIEPNRLAGLLHAAVDGTHIGFYQVGGMVQGLGWEQYPYPVTAERLLAGNSDTMIHEANPAKKLTPPRMAPRATLFDKTGSTRGFGAYVAFVPQKKVGIVMLANKNYPIAARVKAAHAILDQLALPVETRTEDPAISTVTVTAKKEPIVKKLDKTVHDVSTTPRAANGTGQDVLQSTPEVSVTADGQISVKGNPHVTVLVDGKPTAMMSGSGEERAVALQTMSGADIASIEVITNPSAAYNANGGAILNIVLKRNRKPGAHAQIQGSATDQNLWNIGTSGDATRKNISVHGNLAFRHDGTQKFRQSAVDWNNPLSGQAGKTLQASEVFVRRIVESAALGVDDALSDSDSISLSARYNARRSRPLFDVLNENRTGAAETIYHRISYGPNEQSDDSGSLAYSHQGNGTALKAMVQHSDTIGLIDKSYSDVFVEPARATGYSHGATKSARHLSQATIDWSRAWDRGAEHGQWGMGVDIQDKVDEVHNHQASVDPWTAAETPDPDTTNGYAVMTTLSAAYLTDQIRHEKWEVLLGGRAELMALRVDPAKNTGQAKHWRAFNPSLHLKYAFSDKADLALSYRRSLQMPDPRDLNPFTTYVDAQNLSRGNPALKPQIVSSWEVGANADALHLSGNFSAFYRTSRDTVTDARSFADNVLVTSKQNGGRARSAGITGSLDWTPDAKLHLGIDGGAYRVTLHTPAPPGLVRQDGISGYMNLRAAYSVGHDDVSLDAHGHSAGITPLGRYGATSSLNLTWKHQMTRTLSLTVNANDVFDGSRRTYRTDTSTFRQAGFDHFVARRIYVGFVKKIG